MGKMDQRVIDAVLDRANIVDVIGEDVTLKKQGVNYVGLCPFHNERTPSFTVSPSRRICKCFSCGKGGDVIAYVMEHEQMTFVEAVKKLAEKYGIEIPEYEQTDEERQTERRRESCRIVLAEAQNMMRDNLLRDPAGQAYLQSRNVSEETAAMYGIGVAFDRDGLTRSLLAKGYKEEAVVDAGLGYRDEEKNRFRDSFWKRMMFPFYSRTGQVIGYTGRSMDGQMPKYKNTGETMLFTKGNNVYGLYQARNAIQKAGKTYLVEGQFDVLSMAQLGIRNVVGGSGTAFTQEQRRLLKNITSEVVFIYDGDAAGIKAAEKNLGLFVADSFMVKCVRLPDGMDPDEAAQRMKEGFISYLEKNEQMYVHFLWDVLHEENMDDYGRIDVVKRIAAVIACEHEGALRKSFMGELAVLSGCDLDSVSEMVSAVKVPASPERFQSGFFGLEFAQEYIDEDDRVVHLTNRFERFQKRIGEKDPFVFYVGVPGKEQIQELSKMIDRVVVHSPDMECTPRKENADCLMMKELYKYGITVDVVANVADEEDSVGFVYYYVNYYGRLIRDDRPTPETVNEYIRRCAEVISYAPQSIQTINMANWSSLLQLKVATLKELIKPFVNERNSRRKMDKERDDVYNDLQYVDTERVPQYVEESEEYSKMLRRYGFYPLLNKKGMPVCYMFKTDSNSYRRVGDFYIEPQFHIYSPNKEENRRVIRINRLYVDRPTYVEWPSSVFAKLSTLQEMLINEGAYNFENGDARDYAKIWNCISYDFPKCTELKVFGQQEEGCFVFANGIFHRVDDQWKFEYCDELGLMRHGDDIFYSPSFSKINVNVRKDNDKYEQDRWLVYTDTPLERRITFRRWAELMDEVYQINDNGKWALLYAIMCAFRSEIYPINRLFTSLFFIGPTMSGKTQIAVSIRSLFVKPECPSFNLNSGTDAAFFSVLERFRDVPQIMEEYNDEMISDNKFQGLKSVTYDGDGKQKRKAATGNDIETSKVNAPVILLGQESPQKDDNALANRVVLCEVPKRDSINEERAQTVFQELKEHEKDGLSYLLVDVLRLRPLFRAHFADILKEVGRELQRRVELGGNRSGDQTRIINTVSMFCATCKLMTRYAPELELPFTYEAFERLAVEKIRKQVDMLVKTDRLANFFMTIDYLIDKGSVKAGRDFKIETPKFGKVTLKGGVEKVLRNPTDRLLFFNLSNMHKLYSVATTGGEKPLSLTTLEVNLNSCPAYVGVMSNTRFRWMDMKEVPSGEVYKDPLTGAADPKKMELVRIMEPREKMTSCVVLDYELLQKTMSIDFEREVRPENEDIQTKLFEQ